MSQKITFKVPFNVWIKIFIAQASKAIVLFLAKSLIISFIFAGIFNLVIVNEFSLKPISVFEAFGMLCLPWLVLQFLSWNPKKQKEGSNGLYS